MAHYIGLAVESAAHRAYYSARLLALLFPLQPVFEGHIGFLGLPPLLELLFREVLAHLLLCLLSELIHEFLVLLLHLGLVIHDFFSADEELGAAHRALLGIRRNPRTAGTALHHLFIEDSTAVRAFVRAGRNHPSAVSALHILPDIVLLEVQHASAYRTGYGNQDYQDNKPQRELGRCHILMNRDCYGCVMCGNGFSCVRICCRDAYVVISRISRGGKAAVEAVGVLYPVNRVRG